jgi:hypothetical protein
VVEELPKRLVHEHVDGYAPLSRDLLQSCVQVPVDTHGLRDSIIFELTWASCLCHVGIINHNNVICGGYREMARGFV